MAAPESKIRLRERGYHGEKSSSDGLLKGIHHLVFIDKWAFPISSFDLSEFSLLSYLHIPVDGENDAAWGLSHASAIHIEDWTNADFIDETHGSDSNATLPTLAIDSLKLSISSWINSNDSRFGAYGLATLETNPKYDLFRKTVTSSQEKYVQIMWIVEMRRNNRNCVLVVPFEEKDGVFTFHVEKMCTIHGKNGKVSWEKSAGAWSRNFKLLPEETRKKAKELICQKCQQILYE